MTAFGSFGLASEVADSLMFESLSDSWSLSSRVKFVCAVVL